MADVVSPSTLTLPEALGAPMMQPLTEPSTTRPRLTPAQDFRVRVARIDLERARQLDLGGAPPAELVLTVSSLIGSVLDLLRLVGDLAEVTE
ncbi:hypothetical protein ABIA33_003382 [Streptacidiphilus sp. MAP12-16]|uniref:hypothetical protein n=1 Tax=Streptacidiphilus sp. MAP12-16 TaxID=3156300 RepID=UPI003515032E